MGSVFERYDAFVAIASPIPAIRSILSKVQYRFAHIPGNPPLPRIISIWRIIFFPPPPLNIFIIFCIC
jgi:hypothetical protein